MDLATRVPESETDLIRRAFPHEQAEFVIALRDLQLRMEMTDRAFAQEIGVSDALWVYTRLGQRSLSMAVLKGGCRRFKELRPELLSFFGFESRQRDTKASQRDRKGVA